MPKQVFLRAADGRPLVKRFTIDPDTGQIIKHSYPHVLRFTSVEVEWQTMTSLCAALKRYSKEGYCMLKGQLNRPLVNESRAGSTDSNNPTGSMVIDADGALGFSCGQELLERTVGTSKFAYIEQLSSSMGIVSGDAYYAHLIAQLERKLSPEQLKLWMKHLNLSIPELRDQMTLTRSQNALKWPLDVTINQEDKLNYIADPICEDGITDPLKGKRIALRNAKSGVFPVDTILRVDAQYVHKEEIKRLNELREEAGLPRRNNRTKQLKGVAVASAPTIANVTGVKESDDFVYLNLNGGDSWGYYFSKRSPEVLYNFKGEQNYALKDLAPTIYEEYATGAAQAQLESTARLLNDKKSGKVYLGFLEPEQDVYYRGVYEHSTDTLEITSTTSLLKLQHYLKQNGQPMLEVVPEWRVIFDPSMGAKIDVDNRIINIYERPSLLDHPKKGSFPTIQRLMSHMLNATPDSELYDHHMNWLANRVQNPDDLPGTSWLMHGVQGTGKGVWFNYVVKPLVGPDYCQMVRFEEFEEQFNSWAERCLVCFIDEAQADDVRHRDKAHAKLKNQIVEPYIQVRLMRQNPRKVKNRMAFYIASNKPDPMHIEANDRRINVAEYQNEKADFIDEEFIGNLQRELPGFANYLLRYKVDESKVRNAIMTSAKKHIQYLTSNSFDLFSQAFATGNFGYWFDNLPTEAISTDPGVDVYENTRRLQYAAMVQRMYQTYIAEGPGAEVRFTRDEVMRMAKYLLGKVPDGPHKFTSFAKHHNLHFERMRINGRVVQGLKMVIPHIDEELLAAWKSTWEKVPQLQMVKGSKDSNDE